jgi:U3 small nucleolar RNA-associated protein 14
VREVPRAAEPVREVVTSSDVETPEDHDITEVQESPQMTFSHKRKPTWARELIQDGKKYDCSRRNLEIGEKTKSILQLHVFDM